MSDTADYVENTFKSRSEAAAAMLEAYRNEGEYDGQDAGDALAEYPLAIDRKVLITITIGIGGPGDWIDAVCTDYDGALGIDSATHTAAWGSDRKVTTLHPSDALWQLAEHYVESMEA